MGGHRAPGPLHRPPVAPAEAELDLQRVTGAVATGDFAVALGSLLAVWQTTPAIAIANAIDAVGARAQRELALPPGTSAGARNAAWLATANGGDPALRGLLVATLTETKGNAETLVRIEALLAQPRDPRVSATLADLIETPAYNASVSRTAAFWKRLFGVLAELGDPRLLPRARAFSGEWAANESLGPAEREALQLRIQRVMPELEDAYGAGPPSLSPDEQAVCAAAIASAQSLPPELVDDVAVERELLAAVYARPDDDGPRVVYADWLLARGKPRGELIALQIARAQGRRTLELAKREKELLAMHADEWLDSLRGKVQKGGARFERGFLYACKPAIAIDDDPAWATVGELRGALPATDVAMPALRAVLDATDGDLAMLGSRSAPLAIETLAWDRPSGMHGHVFLTEPAIVGYRRAQLPRLRWLRMTGYVDVGIPTAQLAWLWEAPCARQLEHLVLCANLRVLASHVGSIATTDIRRVVFWSASDADGRYVGASYGWAAILERDTAGDLSRLTLISPRDAPKAPTAVAVPVPVPSWNDDTFYGAEVLAGLTALAPAQLTEVRVAIVPAAWAAFELHSRAAFEAAFSRQRRLDKLTIESAGRPARATVECGP